MTETMRAVVIDHPGPPEVLALRDVPLPEVRPGWVLLRVMAAGLNRSELHFRRGVADSGSFPRIPGIEAAGIVEAAPGGELPVGTTAVTMMGGMGRDFDGGYAEHVAVPAAQVIPFTSELPWETLGAVPEMLQTASGSLDIGVRPSAGDTVLIRGGSSSIGLAIATLARLRGLTVLSTTRDAAKRGLLEDAGAHHVVIDRGTVADEVRSLVPEGVHGAVELVGVDVLRDTIAAVRPGGTVCFTGMLSDQWTIHDFYPMDWLPNGVRLTAYSGEAADLSPARLQEFLDAVSAGRATVPIGRTYRLEDAAQAHRDMEAGALRGKGVLVM